MCQCTSVCLCPVAKSESPGRSEGLRPVPWSDLLAFEFLGSGGRSAPLSYVRGHCLLPIPGPLAPNSCPSMHTGTSWCHPNIGAQRQHIPKSWWMWALGRSCPPRPAPPEGPTRAGGVGAGHSGVSLHQQLPGQGQGKGQGRPGRFALQSQSRASPAAGVSRHCLSAPSPRPSSAGQLRRRAERLCLQPWLSVCYARH